MKFALGLVETKGLVGAIEAADAMAKAADVKIIGKEKVTGALMLIKVYGETAAVKASVDAGSAAAQRVGELVSAHVIPRPDDEIDKIIFEGKQTKKSPESQKPVRKKTNKTTISKKEVVAETPAEEIKPEPIEKVTEETDDSSENKIAEIEKPQASTKVDSKSVYKKVPPMEELVVLNVHSLRRIARGFDNFPIKGREISKANRAKLLDYFKELQ